MSLISVYIPTHNRSVMLKRAINSVLQQTYKDIEIIVVDDGSTDNTAEVLEYYAKTHNIIHLKHDKAKGACAARNLAIFNAKGKYITGLDDDDEFLPKHVEQLFQSFEEKYSFIASSLLEYTNQGVIRRANDCGIIKLDKLLHYNIIGNQIFTLTSRLREVGGFDNALPAFQDYDTWVRMVSAFGSGKKVKTATYIWHTEHEESRITNNNTKRELALKLFSQKHHKKMSKAHLKSNYICTVKIEKKAFTFIDLLKNINVFNYKPALSLYVNTNLKALGECWRTIKASRGN